MWNLPFAVWRQVMSKEEMRVKSKQTSKLSLSYSESRVFLTELLNETLRTILTE